MQKNYDELEQLIKDNSFSFNDYIFNIRDSVFSMIVNIISPEKQNSKYLNSNNRKIKSQNDALKKYNNKRISNHGIEKVNKNKTYNRKENNKLYKYFIKKEKKEIINKLQKDRLSNINTINVSEYKMNNHSRNNNIIKFNKDKNNTNTKDDQNKQNNNLNNDKNDNNLKNNFNLKKNKNMVMNTSLNYNKIGNLKMSQKIHYYVQNIIEKIPKAQKYNNIIKEESHEKKEDIFLSSKNLSRHILNKNKKIYSQNILTKKNGVFKNFSKKRTCFNNYIESSINFNIDKINKNKYKNNYHFIQEKQNSYRLSQSTSIKISRNFDFQEILFDIKNIKFKHLLFAFLDQKSITTLSSVNKIFYKNIRNLFFSNISKMLLSENKEIFIKKIIRSLLKYSSFKSKNKSEFKLYYESMKFPNKYYIDIISRDLLRTFPEDPNFNEGNKYYKILFNLLICYSNYNKNIGYAQGLNFLFANAIYLFSSEEEIFLFIDGFINFLKLENFLGINNQKNLPDKINNISDILEKYIPDIINVFNEKFVKIEIFLTNWILTIFSCSMNRKNLIICWCFLILFGWKFFYCFIIQILIQYQSMIFNLNEVDLCKKMKNILHSNEFIQDFNIIINNTIDFMKDHIVL